MGEIERNLLTTFFLIGMLFGATVSEIVHSFLNSRRKKHDADN